MKPRMETKHSPVKEMLIVAARSAVVIGAAMKRNLLPGVNLKLRTGLTIALILSLGGLTAANAERSTSFTDRAGGQHLIYISGSEGDIIHLACTSNCSSGGSWTTQNLTALTGILVAYNNMTSFADSTGEHIFVIRAGSGYYGNIAHLFWNGSNWSWQTLNSKAGAVTNLSGYTAYIQSGFRDRLYYQTDDQHIHLLDSADATNWSDSDLTSFMGGTVAAYGTYFASFVDSSGEHIFYQGTDGRIYQINGSGSYVFQNTLIGGGYFRWVYTRINQNVTAKAGGNPLTGTPLTGFSDSTGEHVYYIDANLHVNELWGDTINWSNLDLSQATCSGKSCYYFGPVVAASYYSVDGSRQFPSGLTSFSDSSGRHVSYIASNMHVYQLSAANGGWSNQDLTASAGGPTAATRDSASCVLGLQVTSYADNTAENVYYVGSDSFPHRLFKTGTVWMDLNLSSSSPLPPYAAAYCYL